jgi:arylsulfatase
VGGQAAAKLKDLQDLFMKEAVKYRVLPIDDRVVERVNAKLAGRPDLMGDRTSLTLHAGMKGMSENVFINAKKSRPTWRSRRAAPTA